MTGGRDILGPLLRLLLDTETPFLVGYRVVRADGGAEFAEYREAVDDLVSSSELRLWEVDWETGERRELFAFPDELFAEYQQLADGARLDHDPHGISITLAEPDAGASEPLWTVDVDSRGKTFRITASESSLTRAFAELEAQVPDRTILETHRHALRDRIHVEGRLKPRDGSAGP